MEPSSLRRKFLWSFLACLAITALVAIAAILDGRFDETKGRVLASSASISGASICAMACAAFVERGRVPWLGGVGIALAGLALLLVLIVLWAATRQRPWGRAALLATIWAVATAHAELLLLPRLSRAHRLVQPAAVAAIGTLATVLSVLVFWPSLGESVLQVVAVLSIVVALLTLAVPVLWKIGGTAEAPAPVAAPRDHLSLRRAADGTWVDGSGRRYAVQPLDAAR